MSVIDDLERRSTGRPRDPRVTTALLDATLKELSVKGLECATVAAIAGRAGASKQAIYLRYKDKTDLVASALEAGLARINTSPAQRGNVAYDLRRYLTHMTEAFQETPLGGAVRAVVSSCTIPELVDVLSGAEADQRLVLRQIFIATPFETNMETRIDLLLGHIYFRLLGFRKPLTNSDIEAAIFLVLGLVAPQDPVPDSGLPGT